MLLLAEASCAGAGAACPTLCLQESQSKGNSLRANAGLKCETSSQPSTVTVLNSHDHYQHDHTLHAFPCLLLLFRGHEAELQKYRTETLEHYGQIFSEFVRANWQHKRGSLLLSMAAFFRVLTWIGITMAVTARADALTAQSMEIDQP